MNPAEQNMDQAFINEFLEFKRDFYDFKTNPQRIGNGSLNYAVFSTTEFGPFTLAAGSSVSVGVTFAAGVLNWEGKPAINRTMLMDPLFSIFIDTKDTGHIWYYGTSLTSGQRRAEYGWHMDKAASGASETNGQRTFLMWLKNTDSSPHDYWIDLTSIIPRPALKQQ